MIIGITGTNGAGKGAVVDYLVQKKGFTHYSARDFITEEIVRRGLPVDRNSTRLTANDLRATHKPEYIIETLYERACAAGGNAVIESIRAIKEAEFLKGRGAHLFAVDADRKTRYERIVTRGSSTDKVDFDTWVLQEEREWHNEEAHDMNVPAVIAMADYGIKNNGTLEELHSKIEEIFTEIEGKNR